MTDKKRRTPSLDIVEVFDPDPARVARAVRLLLAIDLDTAAPADTETDTALDADQARGPPAEDQT